MWKTASIKLPYFQYQIVHETNNKNNKKDVQRGTANQEHSAVWSQQMEMRRLTGDSGEWEPLVDTARARWWHLIFPSWGPHQESPTQPDAKKHLKNNNNHTFLLCFPSGQNSKTTPRQRYHECFNSSGDSSIGKEHSIFYHRIYHYIGIFLGLWKNCPVSSFKLRFHWDR